MRSPSTAVTLQLHDAVVEQEHVAGDHVARQLEVAHADLGRIARRCIEAGDQVEAIARLQRDLALGEGLDADLRARQVGEDADLAADLQRHRTHGFPTRHLRRGIAVGEVQPHHVHARAQHGFQHLGRIRGRPQGGDDAGAALVRDSGLFGLACGHVCGLLWRRTLAQHRDRRWLAGQCRWRPRLSASRVLRYTACPHDRAPAALPFP
jgi:hypothetical protein